MKHDYFATCAPGVETLLYREARALKLSRAEQQVGGVQFSGELAEAWRANLHLRTAVRVLLRLLRFPTFDDSTLYRAVQEVDWSRFLDPEGSLRVDAQCRESKLDHSRFVEQRVKDAIVDQFRDRHGTRPSVDKENPGMRVHVHLYRDRCTLSLDTSGASLHKRGWRQYQGRAPLNEALAAAVLMLSGWDRRAPLIDPFCGGGTLLVEAGLMARGIPAGSFRSFDFEGWPDHDAAAYTSWRQQQQPARRGRVAPLVGREVDGEAVAGAVRNAAAAGLAEDVQIECGDVLAFEPRAGWNAWVVTNPPYGVRVGDAEAALQLHRDFGAWLRQHCAGFHLALLAGSKASAHALSLPQWDSAPLRNGALRCQLVTAEL